MQRDVIRASTFGRLNPRLPSWVRMSETGWLVEGDVVTLEAGFRVAGPGRMLLALAAELNQFAFERSAEDAWKLKLISPSDAAARSASSAFPSPSGSFHSRFSTASWSTSTSRGR